MTDEAGKAHTSHLDSKAPPKEAPARRELVVVVKQEEAGAALASGMCWSEPQKHSPLPPNRCQRFVEGNSSELIEVDGLRS